MRTLSFIKMVIALCALWGTFSLHAQQKQAGSIYNKALSALEQKNATKAEQLLRQSAAVDTTYANAPYNLGTHLYQENYIEEAFGHLKEAAQRTEQPDLIHKTHHNIGNIYMQKEEFENAIEAYKQALRYNPNDEETRYNLALAKQKQQDKEQQQNKDQDDDQQKDQEEKENENQENESDKEKDAENEGDSGDPKEKEKEDPKENGDSSKKEDQKKGQGDQKQEQGRKPQEDQSKGAPKPQELSKEQIETLLQALQNEENKVQEKMNAKKVQGRKLKVEKDW